MEKKLGPNFSVLGGNTHFYGRSAFSDAFFKNLVRRLMVSFNQFDFQFLTHWILTSFVVVGFSDTNNCVVINLLLTQFVCDHTERMLALCQPNVGQSFFYGPCQSALVHTANQADILPIRPLHLVNMINGTVYTVLQPGQSVDRSAPTIPLHLCSGGFSCSGFRCMEMLTTFTVCFFSGVPCQPRRTSQVHPLHLQSPQLHFCCRTVRGSRKLGNPVICTNSSQGVYICKIFLLLVQLQYSM